MTKRLILFLAFWLLPMASAWAADFVATVDSNHVSAGRAFTLQLTLSGANAKSDPNVGALKQAFTIVSEAQSSDTTIGDGTMRSSVKWELMLIPRREGQFVIPPLTVDTDSGVLRTTQVILQVDHGASPTSLQTGADGSMISVTASASTTTPYQNQSLDYTVRSVVRGNLTDVSISNIEVSNAIVKPQGKPVVHNEVENGVGVRVVEFRYIITPLQPGKVTIPPVTLQGKIEAPEVSMNDLFGRYSGAIQQAMNFFNSFGGQPFSVVSNPTLLEVKPPAAAMDPWLPLKSLKIIEDVDTSQSVRVGEPLTRKLTLLADGAAGSQLPDLDENQDPADFKIYADKPATGEDIDAKSDGILGWRKESYSLIALKPGRLVLPPIHVRWWDIVNSKAAIAELPERVVNVLPGVVSQNSPAMGATALPQSMRGRPFVSPQLSMRQLVLSHAGTALFYILLGALAVGLMFTIFWGLKVRRKINHPVGGSSIFASEKPTLGKLASRPITGTTLKSIRTAAELKSFLQGYAHENWGASRNASLEIAFSALSGSKQDMADIKVVIMGIAGALYGGKMADVEDLKKRCQRIIAASRKEAGVRRKRLEKLGCLNPS